MGSKFFLFHYQLNHYKIANFFFQNVIVREHKFEKFSNIVETIIKWIYTVNFIIHTILDFNTVFAKKFHNRMIVSVVYSFQYCFHRTFLFYSHHPLINFKLMKNLTVFLIYIYLHIIYCYFLCFSYFAMLLKAYHPVLLSKKTLPSFRLKFLSVHSKFKVVLKQLTFIWKIIFSTTTFSPF